MFGALTCLFGKHTRDPDRVWNDGLDFRSSCMSCSKPMIKDVDRGWRLFDGEQDFDLQRRGKPSR